MAEDTLAPFIVLFTNDEFVLLAVSLNKRSNLSDISTSIVVKNCMSSDILHPCYLFACPSGNSKEGGLHDYIFYGLIKRVSGKTGCITIHH